MPAPELLCASSILPLPAAVPWVCVHAGSDAGGDASEGPVIVLDEEDEEEEAGALGEEGSGSEGARSLDGFIVRDDEPGEAAIAGCSPMP